MSAVTALVGSGSSARIRPDKFHEEDGTLPAILIEVDNESPQNDLTGRGGLRLGDVTITCRAATRQGARALAEAIRVNGTNPGTGLAGYAGASFDAVLDGIAEAYQPKGVGNDKGYYDTVMSFNSFASETI